MALSSPSLKPLQHFSRQKMAYVFSQALILLPRLNQFSNFQALVILVRMRLIFFNPKFLFRLLHSVLYDYIRACSPEERAELVSTLGPLIVPLSNSLPGANTASMCVWQGTNKDKKAC